MARHQSPTFVIDFKQSLLPTPQFNHDRVRLNIGSYHLAMPFEDTDFRVSQVVPFVIYNLFE